MTKPRRSDEQRSADILEAIGKIESWSARGYPDEEVYRAAVIRELAVIGEAAAHLSQRFRAARPQIPWKQVAALRNSVVHQYWDTKWSILERVVDEDLPPLRATLGTATSRTESQREADASLAAAAARPPFGQSQPATSSERLRCGKWMPISRAHCGRPAGHAGGCKRRP